MPSVGSMQSQEEKAPATRGVFALTTMQHCVKCPVKCPPRRGRSVPTFQPDLQIGPVQIHAQDLSISDICAVGKDDAAGAWDSNVEGGPQVKVELQQGGTAVELG